MKADAELFFPLTLIYESQGKDLPESEVIDTPQLPEPYLSLLNHEGDMTSALETFHENSIVIDVLYENKTSEAYYREVVLLLKDSQEPVEYGGIILYLDAFEEELKAKILEGKLPVGGLLKEYKVVHRSRPKAFISVTSNKAIESAFGLTEPTKLYGRCNILQGKDGETLAQIIEILPPA